MEPDENPIWTQRSRNPKFKPLSYNRFFYVVMVWTYVLFSQAEPQPCLGLHPSSKPIRLLSYSAAGTGPFTTPWVEPGRLLTGRLIASVILDKRVSINVVVVGFVLLIAEDDPGPSSDTESCLYMKLG